MDPCREVLCHVIRDGDDFESGAQRLEGAPAQGDSLAERIARGIRDLAVGEAESDERWESDGIEQIDVGVVNEDDLGHREHLEFREDTSSFRDDAMGQGQGF